MIDDQVPKVEPEQYRCNSSQMYINKATNKTNNRQSFLNDQKLSDLVFDSDQDKM